MSDELSESIKNMIECDKAIISKLNSILYDVNEFHRSCNAARTVGTTVNVLSTTATVTGIFLAPVTAGLSFGLTAAGIAGSIGGTLTNITTDIVDSSYTKKYMKSLKQLAGDHDAELRRFQKIMANLKEIIDLIKEKDGIDEDTAIKATLQASLFKIINIGASFKTAMAAREAIKAANVLSTIKSTGAVWSRSVGNGFITQSFKISSFGKPVADFTNAEMTGLAALLKNPKLASAGSVAGNLAKGVLGAAQIGLTVYEVKTLIDSWNSDRPKN
jgi:hypothetical protein